MISDSDSWQPFQSMNFDHCRGSLNNVGGQLLAIGGVNLAFFPHKKMETFDGTSWTPLTDLDAHRRGFSAVVINSTSLVLIGGSNLNLNGLESLGKDFLIYHVNTKQWVRLTDYPYRETDLACCSFDNGLVQGIFCIGGVGADATIDSHHAIVYDWNTSLWTRASQYDIPTHGTALGSIIQFESSLYYVPQVVNDMDKARFVTTLNLTATTPTWEILQLVVPESSTNPLFYLLHSVTIF